MDAPWRRRGTRAGGATIVRLSRNVKGGYGEVESALAKGKSEYDKGQTVRAQQDRREAQRAISADRER